MAIAPVPAFPFPRRPFSSITPFTYSDAMTHLELLEKLRVYAGVILPAEINRVLDEYSIELTAEVQAAIDLLIGTLNDKIDEINDALADQQADYTQKIADLTVYVDDAVQQVINNSIELQDAVLAGILVDPVSESRVVVDALIDDTHDLMDTRSGVFHVDDEEGASDDVKIVAALTRAAANGGGTVQLAARKYNLENTVLMPEVSNVTIQGTRGVTVIGCEDTRTGGFTIGENVASGGYLTAENTLENITFRGISFDGGLKNIDELGTGKARHQSGSWHAGDTPPFIWGSGLGGAISIYANATALVNEDGDDISNDWPVVRNIIVEECDFIGMSSLPMNFRGIEGHTIVDKCYITRSLDTGFVYCDDVRFTNNTVMYSMDNGVSLSRGCKSVIASGNYVEKPWYNGIWIAGFQQTAWQTPGIKSGLGPARAIVTGNILVDCTEAGVYGVQNDGYVTVTDNQIIGVTAFSGTTQGLGIAVSASNAGVGNAINISGNLITSPVRGGILARGHRNVVIANNVVRNPGSATYPDGTDRPGSISQRFGISWGGTTHIEGNAAIVSGNSVSDTRGGAGAVMYVGIYVPASLQAQVFGNIIRGAEVETAVRLDLPE